MTNPITTTDDIIDSHDVIERIAELKTEFMAATGDDDFDDEFMTSDDYRFALGDDEGGELADLIALDSQGRETFGDEWEYGITLIRADCFTDYARELAEDIGAYDPNAGWPMAHIDWDEAAEALYVDYSDIDFDIYTYYGRV